MLWRILERVSTVAVIFAAAVVGWVQLGPPKAPAQQRVPAQALSVRGAPFLGDSKAPATMVVYSEFQCPFCGNFEKETWPRIREAYVDTAKLAVMFHHLPLPIHASAFRAAEAAECAHRLGRFWEMHDRLFSDQSRLDDATFRRYAVQVGIDEPQWSKCYAGEARTKIEKDVSEARRLGISKTPSFLIGTSSADGMFKATQILSGSLGFEAFRAVIDDILIKQERPLLGR